MEALRLFSVSLIFASLGVPVFAASVLEPGTYRQVRGNCCPVVKVLASNRNSLLVTANGNCGNILTTFNCDDGICTWNRETLAIRSSISFDLFSSYEDGEAMSCRFRRQ
jgi:hypothetical protein